MFLLLEAVQVGSGEARRVGEDDTIAVRGQGLVRSDRRVDALAHDDFELLRPNACDEGKT